jgi:hypothetical protein
MNILLLQVVKSECTVEESILPEKKLRQRRDAVIGGASPANTSDAYITHLADFAVSELDKGTNSLYTQCVVQIVSASKQVCVFDMIYGTFSIVL